MIIHRHFAGAILLLPVLALLPVIATLPRAASICLPSFRRRRTNRKRRRHLCICR